jgi:hypothetical protein
VRPTYPSWLINRSLHRASVIACMRRRAFVAGGLTLVTVAGSVASAHGASRAAVHSSVHRTPSGTILVREPGEGLQLTLSPGQVAVRGAHGLRVALSGPAIGRGGTLRRVRDFAAPSLTNSRVTFSSPGVDEWYAAGRPGFEQGFVITHRPPGPGPLEILHTLAGNATARVEAGAQGVRFTFKAEWLRYTHLIVTDATGDRVSARMSLSGHRLTININDAHAVYPLRVDPSIMGQINNIGKRVNLYK